MTFVIQKRPPNRDKTLHVRVSTALWDYLVELESETGVKKNDIARQALEHALEDVTSR